MKARRDARSERAARAKVPLGDSPCFGTIRSWRPWRRRCRRLSIPLAVVAALAAAAGAPSQARADGDRYAAVTIVNNTASVRIHYRYRWGNGEWKDVTLLPGEGAHDSWEYNYEDEHHSPPFEIQFQTGIGYFESFKTMELERQGSPTHRGGKTYRFVRIVGDKDRLDLRADDDD